MDQVEFQVTGMSCGHCEAAIRSELSEVGVDVVEVASATGRLVVTAPVDDSVVIAAVDEAGYRAVRA